MGEDITCVDGEHQGPVNTCGMMMTGQTPQFYIFDALENIEYISQYTAADGTQLQDIPPWVSLGFENNFTFNR